MDNSVTRIDDRRRRVVSHRQIQVTHAGLELASRAFRLIEIIARILLSPFYPPVRRVRREIPFLFCPESWIIDHPRARDAMNPRRRLHKLWFRYPPHVGHRATFPPLHSIDATKWQILSILPCMNELQQNTRLLKADRRDAWSQSA